jgi:spore maturation protein CgeB
MEFIAQHVDFKWWGIRGPEIDESSALYRTYQGPVAGIEMFRIYKQSKIVVNEYPEMAVSKNVNMRTMEVMNVGSFLLTRVASNIEWLEKAGALVTFNSPEDCLKKIKHYLADDAAREKIAAQGLRTALENFNYRDITRGVMEIIAAAHEKRRSKLKPWSAR